MATRGGWKALSEQEWRKMKRKSKADAALEDGSGYVAPPSKREKRKGSQKQADLPWQTIDIADETIFGFQEQGFGNLQVLDAASVIQNPDGTISFTTEPADPVEAEPKQSKKSKRKTKSKAKAKVMEKSDNALQTKAAEATDAANPDKAATGGNAAKKTKKKAKKKKAMSKVDKTPQTGEETKPSPTIATSTPTPDDLRSWTTLGLDARLATYLVQQGMTEPTPIQKEAIPPALRDHRDVLAAAPTGSGKTLAFGLPILQHVINKAASVSLPLLPLAFGWQLRSSPSIAIVRCAFSTCPLGSACT
eukprot:TRINITY_DN11534_c0_g1_i4.p2 TRINITY_DN11534_c0_g1~~TRINITY_DN11534_c0_g1_i4.p2  ORF type:complete len:305 (+),score=62.89 TRINITY_DN11534_c0_g1_i4:23-937(+)